MYEIVLPIGVKRGKVAAPTRVEQGRVEDYDARLDRLTVSEIRRRSTRVLERLREEVRVATRLRSGASPRNVVGKDAESPLPR